MTEEAPKKPSSGAAAGRMDRRRRRIRKAGGKVLTVMLDANGARWFGEVRKLTGASNNDETIAKALELTVMTLTGVPAA